MSFCRPYFLSPINLLDFQAFQTFFGGNYQPLFRPSPSVIYGQHSFSNHWCKFSVSKTSTVSDCVLFHCQFNLIINTSLVYTTWSCLTKQKHDATWTCIVIINMASPKDRSPRHSMVEQACHTRKRKRTEEGTSRPVSAKLLKHFSVIQFVSNWEILWFMDCIGYLEFSWLYCT